jgi:hypothetical protein
VKNTRIVAFLASGGSIVPTTHNGRVTAVTVHAVGDKPQTYVRELESVEALLLRAVRLAGNRSAA